MLLRLLGQFYRNTRAGMAVTTVLSMFILMYFIYVALDIARYHMINRALSSAAQQTVEWLANRGAIATEDPNALAKQALVARLGSNIIPSDALYSGITSITPTFSYDSTTGISRLIVKANYNLMLRKTFNLQPFAMSADARIKLNPVFVSIVFSSGEMRSEGNDIYGQGLSGSLAPNRGVSWSSPYFTSVIGQTVGTRSTPTHNYYMAAALAKELAGKFNFRKHYMNIIPVSATINLNPLDYTTFPTGTNEKKLPLWVYADTSFTYANTGSTNPNYAICISNRDFYSASVYGHQQDYYYAPASELGATLPIFSKNWFNHDQLLIDSSLKFVIEGFLADAAMPSYFNVLGSHGYPYSPIIGGRCPATNSTPALASFHELTTGDYTQDSRSKASPSENEIFWDYMRTYIDPAKVSNFPIWGSPNMTFGLQIAFENIADVQNFKRINNNNINMYDPASEFFVYVVSDQIGGVKNAGGAVRSDLTNPNIHAFWNLCKNINDWPEALLYCMDDTATNMFSYAFLGSNPTPDPHMPFNVTNNRAATDFQFTHFGWDSHYNMANPACFDYAAHLKSSCDIIYSASPLQVVHNFYNIINYSIDLKYNKKKTKNFKRPKVFFVDTGSGKSSDECQASNSMQNTFTFYDRSTTPSTVYNSPAYHYTKPKPCMAYAELSGYNIDPATYPTGSSSSIIKNTEGGIINIIPSSQTDSNAWISVANSSSSITHASGFDKVFAYRYVQSGTTNRNLDTLAAKNLPIDYYNSSYKLQVRSNSKSSAAYDNSVNNTTNAANIAKYVVKQSLLAPPILRPY